ncbi:MAG: Fe-S oxidoreductase, partial [Armatimonadetes bacterium]|nr:Fe-S oxidoreductase [Armatimonadota bacterium]
MRADWLAIFVLAAVVALALFTSSVYRRISILMLGDKEIRWDQPVRRIYSFLLNVFAQRKLLYEPYGIVHFFIFWGFIVITLGELPLIWEGLFPGFPLPVLGTSPAFFFGKDILSAIVVICLIIAALRRWVLRPPRLYRTWDAAVILLLIFAVIATDWLSTGAKTALEPVRVTGSAPVSNAVAVLFRGYGESTLVAIQNTFWWIHVLVLFTFLVYIPNSKHMHLLAAPFNAFFASLQPRGGQIKPMDLASEEATEYGVDPPCRKRHQQKDENKTIMLYNIPII